VPLEDVELREQIGPLVPGAASDAVLLEEPSAARGVPYRATDRSRPIALVQRDAGPCVQPIRVRAQRAGLFFALSVALASAAAVAQTQRAGASARLQAEVASAAAPRITCREARSVFEYRARTEGPTARALFLTHAQDSTLPEADGVLRLVMRGGGPANLATRDRVLSAIDRIPCVDKPHVTFAEPIYRRFDVQATLRIEKGEEPAAVAQWVNEALRNAFTVDDSDFVEGVQFGYYDRKLRWRIVATIDETRGVRGSEILVDGQREDVALAPAELPVLGKVVLFDASSPRDPVLVSMGP
jgi:hypothetical protein